MKIQNLFLWLLGLVSIAYLLLLPPPKSAGAINKESQTITLEIVSPKQNDIVDKGEGRVIVNLVLGNDSNLGSSTEFDDVKSIVIIANNKFIGGDSMKAFKKDAKGEYEMKVSVDFNSFNPGQNVNFEARLYNENIHNIIEKAKKGDELQKIEPKLRSVPVVVQISDGNGFAFTPPDAGLISDSSGQTFQKDNLVIMSQDGVSIDAMRKIVNDSGEGTIIGWIPDINLFLIELNTSGEQALRNAIEKLRTKTEIASLSPNFTGTLFGTDTDIEYLVELLQKNNSDKRLYESYKKIKLKEAWSAIRMKTPALSINEVKIGALDTGIDGNHIEFTGVNITDSDGNEKNKLTNDLFSTHGTSVVGIIVGNNERDIDKDSTSIESNGILSGVAGVYDSQSVDDKYKYSVVFGKIAPHEYLFGYNDKLKKLLRTKPQIVNISSGFDCIEHLWGDCSRDLRKTTLEKLIKSHSDTLFVVAAGNQNKNIESTFPANIIADNIITVGMTDENDNRFFVSEQGWIPLTLPPPFELSPIFTKEEGSNYGTNVIVSAPGIVIAPTKNNKYDVFAGTSASAPLVAGTAGMLLAIDPNAENQNRLTPSKIKKILLDSANVITTDKPIGKRLNAERAVCAVISCITYSIFPISDDTTGFPHGLATGPDGNLWYTFFYGRVGKIGPDGLNNQEKHTITGFGLQDVTAGHDGNMWFADGYIGGKFYIGKITPNMELAEYEIAASPGMYAVGITIGPDGNVWYTLGSKIGRFNPNTNKAVVFSNPDAPESFSTHYITTGPDGNLWFTGNDRSSCGLGMISVAGKFTCFDIPAVHIIRGPDEHLWITEYEYNNEGGITSSKIARITSDGAVDREYTYPIKIDRITTGPDGNIWFTSNDPVTDRNKIGKMTQGGEFNIYDIPARQLEGITTGPDGNIWLVGMTRGEGGDIIRVNLEYNSTTVQNQQ